MVAFFERGDNGKEVAEDSKEKGRMLSEHETRLVLAVITVGIVLLAIVALVFGAAGPRLEGAQAYSYRTRGTCAFMHWQAQPIMYRYAAS